MKSLITLLTLFLSLNTFAAKFSVISSQQIKSAELRQLVEAWKSQTDSHVDVGSAQFQILSKKPSEDWGNTVAQVLWMQYVTEISALKVEKTESVLKEEVELLIENMLWFMGQAQYDEIEALKVNTVANLLKVVDAAPQIRVYVGHMAGDFDAQYNHISIVDFKNQQIISIFGGYSE